MIDRFLSLLSVWCAHHDTCGGQRTNFTSQFSLVDALPSEPFPWPDHSLVIRNVFKYSFDWE